MNQQKVSAILDAWTDTRATCASVNLWTGGASALRQHLQERARDLVIAAQMIDEDPEHAAELLRGVADHARICARSVDIAAQVSAKSEQSCADCEQ